MRKGVFTILFLLCNIIASYAINLTEVRNAFYVASYNGEVCEEVFNKIKDKDYSNQPVMQAYKGVYTAIMAKYAWNPFTKWKYFREGTSDLEMAISKDSNNIELIFLRFSIQTNSPSFLGYDDNISTDKAFILNALKNTNVLRAYQKFIPDIVNYMINSEYLTSYEKKPLYALSDRLKRKQS